jgi:tetratricopeptide (TPR) repeat protein
VAAIAALAIAGVAAYWWLARSPDQIQPPQAGRPIARSEIQAKPEAFPLHRAAARSRLALLGGGAKSGRTVLVLGKPAVPGTLAELSGTDQAIILRELVRQAVLIAARDELGLSTRDEVLDETPVPDPGKGGVEIASIFRVDSPSRVVVRRDDGTRSEDLLDQEMGAVPNEVGILAMVLPIAERLSRTEFPKTLKDLGARGEPNKVRADAPLPDAVEQRLESLNLIETFSAVRDLHKAIRGDGESPVRLGALARGYARLGVLSEYQWHPAHKAFKARALLYAQRLVARDPASAWAIRNRAFVRALTGLPKEALDDLAAADKAADAAKETTPPPSWTKLIDSYCRYDLDALKSADGPDAGLAALLRLIMVEYPVNSVETVRAGQAVLAVEPDCPRASDSMCRAQQIGTQHMVTVQAPLARSLFLPLKLKALDGLPSEVRDRLGLNDEARRAVEDMGRLAIPEGLRIAPSPLMKPAGRPPADPQAEELALIDALARGGATDTDLGEPSWGALAHLVRETQFVQVYRRLNFMKTMWAVPVDDYWAEARPLVEHHRYRPYLEFLRLPSQEPLAEFVEFAKHVDQSELEVSEYEMLLAMDRTRPMTDQPFRNIAGGHNDAVVADLSAIIPTFALATRILATKSFLMPVAPDWPYARSMLINDAWDTVKDEARDWEKSPRVSPLILASLAVKYNNAKQFDDAERVLRRYIRQSPNLWGYESLAQNFRDRGDEVRWRETLDEYLAKGEDLGLDRALVRERIADDLMRRKKWAEAKPYADAAASSGSSRGMQCAARCAEGMEDWSTAENWYRQVSERYPENGWGVWYLFCKRSGHGELDEAQKWTEAQLEMFKDRPDAASPLEAGYFYWMSGDLKKALECFTREYARSKEEMTYLNMAILADELRDDARRDTMLADYCARFKGKADAWVALCERMRADLASGTKNPLEEAAALDRLVGGIPQNGRPWADYFVGRYLLNRGKAELARIYLRRCADSPIVYFWMRLIASDIVRPPTRAKAK